MKKLVVIFCLLFALVQAAPALFILGTDSTSVFVVDEETGTEKMDPDEKKEKKLSGGFYHYSNFTGLSQVIAFSSTEKIGSSPYLETLTPPPNLS